MSNQLVAVLEKIPTVAMALGIVIYLGWDHYVVFKEDPASPLVQKLNEIKSIRSELEKLNSKLSELKLFEKKLEEKKQELRTLAGELNELKGSISDDLNAPDLLNSTNTEARRVGLSIKELTPRSLIAKEYYAELPITLTFKGQYSQLVLFIDRIVKQKRVIRIEEFSLKSGTTSDLEGVLELKTFKYLGSKEDTIGQVNSKAQPSGDAKGSAGIFSPEKRVRGVEN